MTAPGNGVEVVRRYLEAVVRRAEHHQLAYPEVAGHVVVEVILRHDADSLDCRVPPPASASPIELVFTMQGTVYRLVYTHTGGGHLELCDAERAVVCRFRSGETWAWVNAEFNKL